MPSVFGSKKRSHEESEHLIGVAEADAQQGGETVGPGLVRVGEGYVPEAPRSLADVGYPPQVVADLILKTAYGMNKFTAGDLSRSACLTSSVITEVLDHLRRDKLVEILGEAGHLDFRYAITDQGHLRARQLLDVSGYVGPAPVPVERYSEVLQWQMEHFPPVTQSAVRDAVAGLVIPDNVIEVAGLASASARSLFIFGPAGTGKTTIGHMLHNALGGELWIPHCVGVDSSIVRIYDPALHEDIHVLEATNATQRIDRRWTCVRRPFLVAGGELTLDALELSYSSSNRFYEAPLHMKANGGIFLLDDLGYQRAEPLELLSRWIFPLERRLDYLTLNTGQKMEVPFLIMLIISTNLEPEKVMNAAFLRRMGYRLYMGYPDAEGYQLIFHRFAESRGLTVPPGLLDWLLARYEEEERPLRSCEPRDLIERSRDICKYQQRPFEISQDVIDEAWRGYFGQKEIDEYTAREGHPMHDRPEECS